MAKENLILESKLDSFSGKIVRDIMFVIKQSQGQDVYSELPEDINDDEYYYELNNYIFYVFLHIERVDDLFHEDEYKEFVIQSYQISDNEEGDIPLIEIQIFIDSNSEPQVYEKIHFKLNEDIRHELEHVIQDTSNPTANLTSHYEHHIHPDEIPALVMGYYRRAKLERRPLDDIMIEDLQKEVDNGYLSKEEMEDVLKRLISYAKRRLPKAIYSNY